MEKEISNDPHLTKYVLKSLGKILLVIFIIIICLYLLIILISQIFGSNWKNPTERNYIVFENHSKEEVIDSVYKFMEMIKTYPFKMDSNDTNSLIIMNFVNGDGKTFEINDIKVNDFSFREVRKSTYFSKFSNEQILNFITLYRYLFNIGIDFGVYENKTNYFYFSYKNLYYMYFNPEISSYTHRSLIYYNGKKIEYFYHRIILDNYQGFYLTCSGEDTTSTDIPYKILDKFKK